MADQLDPEAVFIGDQPDTVTIGYQLDDDGTVVGRVTIAWDQTGKAVIEWPEP